jgi:hypothetical protein
MDELIVVTHPDQIELEARQLETEQGAEEGNIALAYYCDGRLLARGFVAPEAVPAIQGILKNPVSVALAGTEDDNGNIDARFCLVLPVDPEKFSVDDEDGEPEEPWRASLPDTPAFESSSFLATESVENGDQEDRPRVALLPIGNIVRHADERQHPDDLPRDLRDMMVNLMEGRAKDAVAKAIDDLLKSI